MVRGYEDWDFWVSCVERGYLARRIPEPLFKYRVRPGSMFANALAHDAELRRQIRRNHPRLYGARRRVLRWALLKMRGWTARFRSLLVGAPS